MKRSQLQRHFKPWLNLWEFSTWREGSWRVASIITATFHFEFEIKLLRFFKSCFNLSIYDELDDSNFPKRVLYDAFALALLGWGDADAV